MGKMSAEEMGILFAGISSILATLIYFTKNIKQSSCCGNDCKQVVTDQNGNVLNRSTLSNIDCLEQAMDTFPPTQIPPVAPVPAPRPYVHPMSAII
jgi:hypothetical protein